VHPSKPGGGRADVSPWGCSQLIRSPRQWLPVSPSQVRPGVTLELITVTRLTGLCVVRDVRTGVMDLPPDDSTAAKRSLAAFATASGPGCGRLVTKFMTKIFPGWGGGHPLQQLQRHRIRVIATRQPGRICSPRQHC